MAESFSLSELVIPGTYIRVRAEGLISVGGISTGNIGIVGTSAEGTGETHILSDYDSARATFGDYDAYDGGNGILNLTRGLELLYQNGARTVFARSLDPADDPGQDDFIAEFNELAKDDVNILVAPELATSTALAIFGSVLETAENSGKDMIAVVGCDETAVTDILGQVTANDRIIMTTPGIQAYDAAAGENVNLNGTYSAAAVAGLISTLAPQASPTNKVLPGVVKLAQRFSYGEMVQLVDGRLLVLEERRGIRVVRGLTTDDGAFTQVTTRRITDFAKAGIRLAADPFIGRLNNERVRKALQGAIDGFLTTMVQDEALVGYELAVTATRQDEIAGRAIVNAVLQPTFSIDFVAVTLVLQ
jgi:hypothetical protein